MVEHAGGQWNVATKENTVYLERVSEDSEQLFEDALAPEEARQLARLLTKHADKISESGADESEDHDSDSDESDDSDDDSDDSDDSDDESDDSDDESDEPDDSDDSDNDSNKESKN
jgi:hypothetical protein